MDTLSRSNTLLLHHLHHSPPSTPPWRFPIATLSLSTHAHSPLLRKSLLTIAAQKYDFGPPTYDDDDGGRKTSKRRRRRRSKRRQWWFDDAEPPVINQPQPSLLDQVVDSLWFFKVLESYGWFWPAIMISLLLATGPKAFLMAFSLPLGFSVLALAFQKLSAWLEGNPEPKQTRKTKSPFSMGEDEDDSEEEEEDIQPRKRAQKRRYRSQAAGNNGPVFTRNSSSKFGGWDELITEEEETNGTSRPDEKTYEQKTQEMNGSLRPDRKTDERNTLGMNGSLRPDKKTDERNTLGMNGSLRPDRKTEEPIAERELPLLLKLLVALFPFLGSWTSLL